MSVRCSSMAVWMLAWCWMLVASGCARHVSRNIDIDRLAEAGGMERKLVEGARFRHLLYLKGDLGSASRVHVYLEGDGLPWRTRDRIASDPTPRNPLALRLMAQDSTPSIYVGRPCYFGLNQSHDCSLWTWSHGRYGEDVVESLLMAVKRVLPFRDTRRITLIGYSGGGALAALIAPRLAGVTELVTVAANLDIDAWTQAHGYSPLTGSLNPAAQAPIDSRIRQLHLLGARDREVPAKTLGRFLAHNRLAEVKVVSGFDHRCCWVARWPLLLGWIGR